MVQWLNKQQVLRLIESSQFTGFWLEDDEKGYFGTGKDVALYWDGTYFLLKPASGATLTFAFAAGITTVSGGTATSDKIVIRASVVSTSPILTLADTGQSSMSIWSGRSFIFKEQTTDFLVLDRSGSTYTTDATGTVGFTFDVDTVTTSQGIAIDARGLTEGIGVYMRVDSDTLTTGSAWKISGGAVSDQSWLEVIKNVNDTEGCQVIIDGSNAVGTAATPSLRIGDTETGLFISSAGRLSTSIASVTALNLSASQMWGSPASWMLKSVSPSATVPIYVNNAGQTSGLGFQANDSPSLISAGAEKLRVDGTATAADTALLIYDVDNATVERVTVGVADSGGAGFKVLRIAN